jgi:uncharacterized protein YceK
MFRKLLAATALAGVLVMSGCASVPMASKSADTQAKQFTPATDKATVYIYRNEVFGSAIKMPLLIDNMSVGDTASKTYVVKQLSPGGAHHHVEDREGLFGHHRYGGRTAVLRLARGEDGHVRRRFGVACRR